MQKIEIVLGDITTAQVDVIVNAANPYMLGGGGVDGAIHRVAGPELFEACKKVEEIHGVRCPTGEARITIAGNLPSRYVIHTVGPIYEQADDPATLLASAYFNSLKLAVENNCQSIAFPAISCGVYGYPAEAAAKISLEVCSQHEFNQLNIYFYLFSESMIEIWRRYLEL